MKDLKHASVRGVAWNLIQNVISRMLGLVVVAILGRILDRSDFGAVALAAAITTFGEVLVNQGYGDFITQNSDLTPEHLDTAFWSSGLLGLVLTAAIAAVAVPLASEFADASVAPIVRWLSLSLLIRSFSVVPVGLLIRQLRFRSLSVRGIAASGIGGIAGITVALLGFGVYSLVVQALVGEAAATIILWGATDWRPGLRFSTEKLKEMTAFGAPIFGVCLVWFLVRRVDTMIVVGALGLTSLAVYSMAQRVFQIANQVLNKSSDGVAFSALARLADAGERQRKAFFRMIELSSIMCFPIYATLAIAAAPLTVTLFGPRWADSAPVLTVFAIAGIPVSLSYVHGAAMKSTARTRVLLITYLILAAIYLPVMALMVPDGPASGAAAYLVGSGAIVPIEIAFLRVVLGINVAAYARAIVGASLATIAMSSVTLVVAGATEAMPPIVRLALEGAFAATTYVVALRVLAPTTFQHCIELVRSSIRRPPTPQELA
jgi:O-antigen/teichoic acid export membrane protein